MFLATAADKPAAASWREACAMTTKFLDNKICTFKILLSLLLSPPPKKKTAFWTIFLSAQFPPRLKHANSIFIVVSPSLNREKGRKTAKTHPESAFRWALIGWVLGLSLSYSGTH